MELSPDNLWDLAQVLMGPGGGVLGFVLAARGKFADVLHALDGIQKTLGEMRTVDALLGQRVATCEAEILELRRRTHDLAALVSRRHPSGEFPRSGGDEE